MYDKAFYDLIRKGCQDSAAEIVPRLFELIQPQSVVDVGCGEGWWLHQFVAAGAQAVLGIDGHDWNREMPIGNADYYKHDLNQPIPAWIHDAPNPFAVAKGSRPFDLAISLEVAEHLQPDRATSFVRDLCLLAPVVVFSAAIPGQGGVGHINERWPQYWTDLFGAEDYEVSGALRFEFWDNDRVENWYSQNILVALDCECQDGNLILGVNELFVGPAAKPINIVHPRLWNHARQR